MKGARPWRQSLRVKGLPKVLKLCAESGLFFIFLFIFLLLLHKSERFTLHIGLNWCVFHLVSPFQGSSEICNIQMSLDCEQAGLEV